MEIEQLFAMLGLAHKQTIAFLKEGYIVKNIRLDYLHPLLTYIHLTRFATELCQSYAVEY